MSKFGIRAPGKVILHGEHAVVYNRPAIAAAIGLGTTLQFEVQPGRQTAKCQLDALNSSFEIKVAEFNDFLCAHSAKFAADHDGGRTALLEALRQQMFAHVVVSDATSALKQPQAQQACLAINYVLAGVLLSAPRDQSCAGFDMQIDTELGIGAGLGSSASFGVAIATAFLIFAGHFDTETYELPDHQALISQWAYESERVMHGAPSGVDNTVCTYGGALEYAKTRGFRPIHLQQPLSILLVDSRVIRSTADVVAKVRHLVETFPCVVEAIWQTCERLVEAAIPLYENFGNGKDDSEKFEQLERLFQINNDLLKSIGASHPKLEQIFAIAAKRGFFSKLTGAGCGGYAIILLPANYEANEVYGKMKTELEAAGFDVRATTAGGVGLRVFRCDS